MVIAAAPIRTDTMHVPGEAYQKIRQKAGSQTALGIKALYFQLFFICRYRPSDSENAFFQQHSLNKEKTPSY